MIVIPSLNCEDLRCVRERTRILRDMHAPWVHIDVADGVFAPVVLSKNAGEIKKIFDEEKYKGIIEAHLMVARPEQWTRAWLEYGARRILIHAEALSTIAVFERIKSECDFFGAELGIAVKAETAETVVKPFLTRAAFYTILAVPIGFSGGVFERNSALKKIVFLRRQISKATIEIDGGMNPETGVLVKNAGVGVIVSGAFIFSHKNPKEAFHILENL